jgi:acyl-CoA reductase-like NAD-dependent aldehyde dehydrogenase
VPLPCRTWRSPKPGGTVPVLNSGQSCLAAKRFVAEEAVADEFERRFVEAVAALAVGTRWVRSPAAIQ